ncbi:hypothetical protein V1477_016739 [Vespula maculifrons]|uniref:Uncharacterized protein n=1 Tax=Vespula maculifrons TaxID=7453 RepID=A0ABD2B437_VESMC
MDGTFCRRQRISIYIANRMCYSMTVDCKISYYKYAVHRNCDFTRSKVLTILPIVLTACRQEYEALKDSFMKVDMRNYYKCFDSINNIHNREYNSLKTIICDS